MEETAFFLDLTVGGCAPVILTGAMRQANWAGADGPANLLNSVRLAASVDARGRGALLLMNDEVFLAREVTKSNTTRLNAFSAPEAGPAGVTDPDGVFFRTPAPTTCPAAAIDVERVESFPRVDIVYSHIGADRLSSTLSLLQAQKDSLSRALVAVAPRRRKAVPCSLKRRHYRHQQQNRGGRAGRPTAPESLRTVPEGRGARLSAGDLNPQKARMLLSLALATGLKPAAIATLIASVQ
jgi:L-asparaginase